MSKQITSFLRAIQSLEIIGFRAFFDDPVRLGNRTYRAWGENQTEE